MSEFEYREILLDNWPDPNYGGWRQDAEQQLTRIEWAAVGRWLRSDEGRGFAQLILADGNESSRDRYAQRAFGRAMDATVDTPRP